jgi:hypothetical protein
MLCGLMLHPTGQPSFSTGNSGISLFVNQLHQTSPIPSGIMVGVAAGAAARAI